MQAAKREALDAIARLPDDTDMDEIMYQLYMLDASSAKSVGGLRLW